jgi:hypothetical protein
MFLNALLNQTTMLSGVIGPPRSDVIKYSDGAWTCRHASRAAARSGWMGIDRPLHFFAASSRSSINPLIWPFASATMSQVKLAISLARSPALADSNTITRLRSGLRMQLAKTRRSLTSAGERVFACLPGMVKGFENMNV